VLRETCAQKNIALYSRTSFEIFFMTNDGNKHNDVSRQALDNKHKENSREGKEQGRFARTGRHCLQQLLHLSSADGLASAPQRRQPVRSGVISPQRRETYLTPCTKTAAGSSTFWISQMIDETASRQLHGVCFLYVCPEPVLVNVRFISMRSRRIRKDQKTARKKTHSHSSSNGTKRIP
jgi:hypothetical protein